MRIYLGVSWLGWVSIFTTLFLRAMIFPKSKEGFSAFTAYFDAWRMLS